MHRWTARFLTLVMLVPFLGPAALARVASSPSMHCARMRMADASAPAVPATPARQPAMHCHGMAQQPAANAEAPKAQSTPSHPEASFTSRDCCCCDHNCCRSTATSGWAQPASRLSSLVNLTVESAARATSTVRLSAPLLGGDSARAPPRS
ncbi:MAG TPA: hypothetical protein VMI10_07460 [Terriglobales bacterium]|nr:hypothetical protein [Terriglobales bacterium]HVM91170.1 hypothetical protein [Terriglobales bacterium]